MYKTLFSLETEIVGQTRSAYTNINSDIIIFQAEHSNEHQGLPVNYCLRFICPKTNVNGHPVSLRVMCGQHVEYPNSWVSRLELRYYYKFNLIILVLEIIADSF